MSKFGTKIKMTLNDRMALRSVHKDNGCIEWTGWKTKKGYGCCRFNGKRQTAHRWSYELHNGPINDKLFVMHKCDNPACINPDHLKLGTNYDNIQDMVYKKRHRRFEMKPNAKLDMNKAIEIRLLGMAKMNHLEISQIFKVCRPLVTEIINRRRWVG